MKPMIIIALLFSATALFAKYEDAYSPTRVEVGVGGGGRELNLTEKSGFFVKKLILFPGARIFINPYKNRYFDLLVGYSLQSNLPVYFKKDIFKNDVLANDIDTLSSWKFYHQSHSLCLGVRRSVYKHIDLSLFFGVGYSLTKLVEEDKIIAPAGYWIESAEIKQSKLAPFGMPGVEFFYPFLMKFNVRLGLYLKLEMLKKWDLYSPRTGDGYVSVDFQPPQLLAALSFGLGRAKQSVRASKTTAEAAPPVEKEALTEDVRPAAPEPEAAEAGVESKSHYARKLYDAVVSGDLANADVYRSKLDSFDVSSNDLTFKEPVGGGRRFAYFNRKILYSLGDICGYDYRFGFIHEYDRNSKKIQVAVSAEGFPYSLLGGGGGVIVSVDGIDNPSNNDIRTKVRDKICRDVLYLLVGSVENGQEMTTLYELPKMSNGVLAAYEEYIKVGDVE